MRLISRYRHTSSECISKYGSRIPLGAWIAGLRSEPKVIKEPSRTSWFHKLHPHLLSNGFELADTLLVLIPAIKRNVGKNMMKQFYPRTKKQIPRNARVHKKSIMQFPPSLHLNCTFNSLHFPFLLHRSPKRKHFYGHQQLLLLRNKHRISTLRVYCHVDENRNGFGELN